MIYKNKHKNLDFFKAELLDLKKYAKPHWWENLPIIGSIEYMIRMQNKDRNVKNNELHQTLMSYRWKFVMATLILGFILLILITPWFVYLIHILAIKKINKKLELLK